MRRAALVVLFAFLTIPAVCRTCDTGLESYVGTYVPREWSVEGFVEIGVREGVLTWGPPLWKPARILRRVSPDVFEMVDRSDRRFRFHRNGRGCVVALEGFGFPGVLHLADRGNVPPLRQLLSGNTRVAVRMLRASAGNDPNRLVELVHRMLTVPSAIPAAQALANELVRSYGENASVWTALGDAQVASRHQKLASESFKRALKLDPDKDDAKRSLSMILGTDASSSGLPFSLHSVFLPPSPREVEEVRSNWKSFKTSPKNIRTVREDTVEINGARFHVRILSHDVDLGQELGVILVPENASGKLPVIVEAKGVSPGFFPLTVPDGINLGEILGASIGQFVIALPGFRGEEVRFKDGRWKSDTPHDSWSGAADDLLSFLDVVLSTTPQADDSRIGIFGRSRGGTVALLAGERDPRIRCVVAWAAPTDWFSLMAHGGWTLEQSVGDAVRHNATLPQREGQYVYNFLRYALSGREGISQVRARLLASSPLYFAESLPATQVHYGVEDSMVPVINGSTLVKHNRDIDAHFHADAGHDQDLFDAPRQTRQFLFRYLRPGAKKNQLSIPSQSHTHDL